jgi:hypothetical protein
MAHSDNLKSLRTHSNILSLVIIGLILFLLMAPENFFGGNSVEDSNSVLAKIIAKKGASIRDKPSKNGKILIIAPANSEVKIIQRKVQNDIVDNKQGSWVKVRYLGKTGYVWEYLID